MSPSKLDYFEVLGVDPTASNEEVRKKFQALAKSLHPDVNASPDAAARFQTVKEAYDILKNPFSRRAFEARRNATGGVVYYDPVENSRIKARAQQFQRSYQIPYSAFWRRKALRAAQRLLQPKVLLALPAIACVGGQDQYVDPDSNVVAWFNPSVNQWQLPDPLHPDFKANKHTLRRVPVSALQRPATAERMPTDRMR